MTWNLARPPEQNLQAKSRPEAIPRLRIQQKPQALWEAQELVQSHVQTEMKKKAEIEDISGRGKWSNIHQTPKNNIRNPIFDIFDSREAKKNLGQERAGKKASKSHTPTENQGFPARPGA